MADSSVPITGGTGYNIDTRTESVNGDHRQVFVLGDPVAGTSVAGVRPDGTLNISEDPKTLLYDGFDTLDTTNTWTTSGTAPTLSNGTIVNAAGTTASAASRLISQSTFVPGSNAFLKYASIVQIESAVTTGSVRWWGVANPNTSAPTVTTALTAGAVFEIDSASGALYGRIYSGNAKIAEVALTRPTDGAFHRYQILFKASHVYFNIDGVEVGAWAPTTTLIAAAALPVSHGVLNGTTALGAAATLTVSLTGMADTAGNFSGIRDGQYPWRRAQVDSTSRLAVAAGGLPLNPAPSAATNIAAATTTYTVNVGTAGNVTFWLYGAAGAAVSSGVVVFEQSVDNTYWAPLMVVRSDGTPLSTSGTLNIAANSSLAFDAGCEGVNWVRVRTTTTSSQALTAYAAGGGMPFSPVVAIGNTPNVSVTNTPNVAVTSVPALTKGTQQATGFAVQDLKDSGRAPVSYYTSIPVATSATEALLNLTGTKANATVAATTTPAVVTAGKTFRVQQIQAQYISTATSGYAMVRLRYNTGGVVALASPVLASAAVGNGSPVTANASGMVDIDIPDGLEFAAGTGIGITAQGFAGVTATAVGYVNVMVTGYEY